MPANINSSAGLLTRFVPSSLPASVTRTPASMSTFQEDSARRIAQLDSISYQFFAYTFLILEAGNNYEIVTAYSSLVVYFYECFARH